MCLLHCRSGGSGAFKLSLLGFGDEPDLAESAVLRGGPGLPMAKVDWAAPGLSTRKIVVAARAGDTGYENDALSPPGGQLARARSIVAFTVAGLTSPATVTSARAG